MSGERYSQSVVGIQGVKAHVDRPNSQQSGRAPSRSSTRTPYVAAGVDRRPDSKEEYPEWEFMPQPVGEMEVKGKAKPTMEIPNSWKKRDEMTGTAGFSISRSRATTPTAGVAVTKQQPRRPQSSMGNLGADYDDLTVSSTRATPSSTPLPPTPSPAHGTAPSGVGGGRRPSSREQTVLTNDGQSGGEQMGGTSSQRAHAQLPPAAGAQGVGRRPQSQMLPNRPATYAGSLPTAYHRIVRSRNSAAAREMSQSAAALSRGGRGRGKRPVSTPANPFAYKGEFGDDGEGSYDSKFGTRRSYSPAVTPTDSIITPERQDSTSFRDLGISQYAQQRLSEMGALQLIVKIQRSGEQSTSDDADFIYRLSAIIEENKRLKTEIRDKQKAHANDQQLLYEKQQEMHMLWAQCEELVGQVKGIQSEKYLADQEKQHLKRMYEGRHAGNEAALEKKVAELTEELTGKTNRVQELEKRIQVADHEQQKYLGMLSKVLNKPGSISKDDNALLQLHDFMGREQKDEQTELDDIRDGAQLKSRETEDLELLMQEMELEKKEEAAAAAAEEKKKRQQNQKKGDEEVQPDAPKPKLNWSAHSGSQRGPPRSASRAKSSMQNDISQRSHVGGTEFLLADQGGVPLAARIIEAVNLVSSQLQILKLGRAMAVELKDLLGGEYVNVYAVPEQSDELWLISSPEYVPPRVSLLPSIATYVFKTRKMANCSNIEEDNRFRPEIDTFRGEGEKPHNMLCAAVVDLDGKASGVVQIMSKDGGFTKQDEEVMRTLSQPCGIACRNALDHSRALEDTKASSVLLSASDVICRELKMDNLTDAVVESVQSLVEVECVLLYLLDPHTGNLMSIEGGLKKQFPITTGIAGKAATEGSVVRTNNAYFDPNFDADVDERVGRTASLLACPCRGRNKRVVAVVELLNRTWGGKPSEFTDDDVRRISALSVPIGASVDKSISYENLVSVCNSYKGALDHLMPNKKS